MAVVLQRCSHPGDKDSTQCARAQPESDVISLCQSWASVTQMHLLGKKGWHHIVSSREEEQSIDFGEKTAVSASWNIIKLYKNYKNIIKIICYTDARHPHQPMDTNEMTLIFMSKFAKNSVSTD